MVGIPKEVLDEIDHISNRVTIGAFSGIFLGAAIATYRGFPILRTSLTVAASCAMTGTACFITERAAYATLTSITKQDTENETMKVVASHSIGGNDALCSNHDNCGVGGNGSGCVSKGED
eukprot:11304004-Ditylum_brightwellii.AAC.1